MSACESVDLPDPFGPISACTSPERTSRSTPRRISCPATLTCRSRIVRVAHGSTTFTSSPSTTTSYDGHRLRRGQRLRLAGLQRERRAVLRALDLALVLPHVALGERVVGVRALVADRVEVVADAHDRDAVTVDVEAARRTRARGRHARTERTRRHPSSRHPPVLELVDDRAPQTRASARSTGRRVEHVVEEPEHDQALGFLGRDAARSRGSRAGRRRSARRSTRASTARRSPRSRGSGSTPRSRLR